MSGMLLSMETVAARLGVSPEALSYACRQDLVPFHFVGVGTRFRSAAVRFTETDVEIAARVDIAGKYAARAGRTLLDVLRREASGIDDSSFVYFIGCEAMIKVGSAKDTSTRLRELQVGNPFPLSLLGAVRGGRPLELAIHQRLAPHRQRGEWFRAEPPVRALIANVLGSKPGA